MLVTSAFTKAALLVGLAGGGDFTTSGKKFDTRSNVVNVFLNMSRDVVPSKNISMMVHGSSSCHLYVLVTGNIRLASGSVFVDMILGVQ